MKTSGAMYGLRGGGGGEWPAPVGRGAAPCPHAPSPARRRAAAVGRLARDAEVRHLELPLRVEEEVLGLYVSAEEGRGGEGGARVSGALPQQPHPATQAHLCSTPAACMYSRQRMISAT